MFRRATAMAFIFFLGLLLYTQPAALPRPIMPVAGGALDRLVLAPPPLEADGHILVSAGDFLPLAGGSADWYQNRGVLRGRLTAAVTAGSATAVVDGVTRHLPAAPQLVDGRLYIPLELALEVLGLPVNSREAPAAPRIPAPGKLNPDGQDSGAGSGHAAGGGFEPAPAVAVGPGRAAARDGARGDAGDNAAAAGETAAAGTAPGAAGFDAGLPSLKSRKGAHFRYYPVYDLQAEYDPSRGEIRGELFLAYQNPYLNPLRRLYFNLPAGAPFGSGAATAVQKVEVDNRPASFNLRGSSLEVILPRTLAPRETLALSLSFATSVPATGGRLGYTGEILTAAGWYPLLATLEDGKPAIVASTPFGDPYFAPAAYYQVRLTLPAGYQVLASGRTTGRQERGGRTTWTFNSDHPVREFAFVAAPGWQLTALQAGNTRLVAAARGEPAGDALETAAQALAFFQEIYGPYPYSYLHLAFVPLDNLAGMEYPGLILLSNRKIYSPSTVVHEVAHQWWYNLVGNDSCRAAWIDEGLAEYSTLLFFRRESVYRAPPGADGDPGGRPDLPLDLSLEEYGDEQSYRRAVYDGGRQFWLEMEAAAGRDGLLQALAYTQQYYRYEIVPPRDLQTILAYYGGLQREKFTSFFRN